MLQDTLEKIDKSYPMNAHSLLWMMGGCPKLCLRVRQVIALHDRRLSGLVSIYHRKVAVIGYQKQTIRIQIILDLV
jgi:hypothetical protein